MFSDYVRFKWNWKTGLFCRQWRWECLSICKIKRNDEKKFSTSISSIRYQKMQQINKQTLRAILIQILTLCSCSLCLFLQFMERFIWSSQLLDSFVLNDFRMHVIHVLIVIMPLNKTLSFVCTYFHHHTCLHQGFVGAVCMCVSKHL